MSPPLIMSACIVLMDLPGARFSYGEIAGPFIFHLTVAGR